MKKNYFSSAALCGMALLLGTVVTLSSCSADAEAVINPSSQSSGPCAPVRVRVSDFSMSMDDMSSGGGLTRAAQNPGDYFTSSAMTLAFYDAGGTEVYKTTQVQGDGTYTTFGEFTANLPVGTYTMVALGYAYYDGDVFFLTSPTAAGFTSERPRETFCKTQSVTVTSSAPLDLTVTLNRIVSALDINSTDNRPAGIAKIRTTYAKGGKAFDPTTGLATSDAGFTQTNTPSAAVGAHIGVSSFPFLATDEEDIDVTIEVLDAANNVLFTHTASNVPFKRNRKTILTGNIFTASASSAAFRFETDWLTSETIPF